jgi:hypothetical protein
MSYEFPTTIVNSTDPLNVCPYIVDESMRTLLIIRSAKLGLFEIPIEILLEINKHFYGRGLITKSVTDEKRKSEICTLSVKGRRHGLCYQLYADKTYSLRGYVDGKLHGPSILFHENGLVREKCSFINDEISGEHTTYLQNGSIYSRSVFVNGKKNGPAETYFDNGAVYDKSNYVNDKLHGEYRRFYITGNIDLICNYEHDRRFGSYILFDEDGPVNETRDYT